VIEGVTDAESEMRAGQQGAAKKNSEDGQGVCGRPQPDSSTSQRDGRARLVLRVSGQENAEARLSQTLDYAHICGFSYERPSLQPVHGRT
jgi:hypothetical protein